MSNTIPKDAYIKECPILISNKKIGCQNKNSEEQLFKELNKFYVEYLGIGHLLLYLNIFVEYHIFLIWLVYS